MQLLKKFQEKLVLQLLALVFFLFLVLLCAFCAAKYYTQWLVQESTLELGRNNLTLAKSRLEEHYEGLGNLAAALSYSPTTEQYFSQDSLSRFSDAENLSAVFSNSLLLNGDIRSIYLYQTDMERIASFGKEFPLPDMPSHPPEESLVGSGFFSENTNHLYYTFFYPIYDLRTPAARHLLGMCAIILTPDSLDDILLESMPTEHSELYLLDQNGQILSASLPVSFTHFPDEKTENTSEYQALSVTSPTSGWRIVCRIPTFELRQQDTQANAVMALLGCISVALLLLLIGFCYFHIICPLRQVDGFIRRNMEQPEERLKLNRADEIGTVSESLNQLLDTRREMHEKIQLSQKQMYEIALAKKQAQVIAYQSQINPHFLYNTLECMRDMALYYEADSIAEMTMALSFLFRYAVKGNSVVTVADEVSYIQEYAKIIAYRFMGKIAIDVEMETGTEEKQLMKMMLQPLVENAVFHGLEQQEEDGTVDVRIAAQEKGRICITVSDDGCGMEQEQLEKVMADMQKQDNQEGIGIGNIYQRLRLFYGEAFSFSLESKAGVGTCVLIEVPGIPGEIEYGLLESDKNIRIEEELYDSGVFGG